MRKVSGHRAKLKMRSEQFTLRNALSIVKRLNTPGRKPEEIAILTECAIALRVILDGPYLRPRREGDE